jgi:hypothetical protein
MGGANGSRECAPDDKLRDTHRVNTHAKQADGFRERSTHPTGFVIRERRITRSLSSGAHSRDPLANPLCGLASWIEEASDICISASRGF